MMTVLGVAAAIYGVAYFLPTIIACCRDTKGKGWIFALNLFFGLSGFGYAMAMMQCGYLPTHAELERPPNASGCRKMRTALSSRWSVGHVRR